MNSKIIEIERIGSVLFERSSRAKHLNISVKAPAKVRVAVPRGISFEKAKNFTHSKIGWISKHLLKIQLRSKIHLFDKPVDKQAAKAFLEVRIEELADKFSFVPKDGISYKIIFKVIVLAENNKHNAYAKIESKITGKRTFLGNFSINDRSKGIDQSIKTMIVKLENNIEDEINKKFQDFLTNKYN